MPDDDKIKVLRVRGVYINVFVADLIGLQVRTEGGMTKR
jgi:hypothetical protein